MKVFNFLAAGVLAGMMLASCGGSQPQLEGVTKAQVDSVSYAVGVTFGSMIKNANLVGLDYSIVTKTMKEVANGGKATMHEQEAGYIVNDYMQKCQIAVGRMKEKEEAEFLAKNKKQKGKTLFIDARKLGTMVTRKLRELTDEDIAKIEMGSLNVATSTNSITNMTEISSSKFTGVYEVLYTNLIGKSDFLLNIYDFQINGGNFKMVVVHNGKIIHTLTPENAEEYFKNKNMRLEVFDNAIYSISNNLLCQKQMFMRNRCALNCYRRTIC